MTDLILTEPRKPGEDIQTKEAEKAQPWLDMIEEAKRVLAGWQDRSDAIDKLYANLEMQANAAGDREFAMFWANLQVLTPAIYTRPPVPVVSPKFNDRKPLDRAAAEVLERALVSFADESDLHSDLVEARDDLARSGRGVVWIRWDDGVTVEHLCRQDFLHEPARKWKEVTWVARAAWMTAKDLKKRFKDADLSKIDFGEQSHGTGSEGSVHIVGPRKALVWEIWHKTENRVLWVSPDCEDVLESRAPHLKLDGFFPCPKPVYGTLQPYTLIPVPDWLYYRDQLDEINDLTARISALTEALKVRGLIAMGHEGGVGDAVRRALEMTDDRQILIPVPSLSGMTTGSGGGLVEWLPIEMVANTIQVLIALRQQLIQDVYEITGLSDIMRGQTNANETLGAQQLKSQYGSIRISERQGEMVRLARDVLRIAAEIMAEEMDGKDLFRMAQVDDIPERKDIKAQIKAMEDQARQMMAQAEQAAQQGQPIDPEQAQQMVAQYQQQRAALEGTITREDIAEFLRDEHVRPFALDIETDSTIAPDEQAEKQRKTEFLTAVGGFMAQTFPLVQALPTAAPMAAEMLRFAASAFRSSRRMDAVIDDFAEKIEQAASQPQPDPMAAEKMKLEAEQQAKQAEMQVEAQKAQAEAQREGMRAQADANLKAAQAEKTRLEAREIQERLQVEGEKRADKLFNEAMKEAAEGDFAAAMQSVPQ